jgi:hypothetical protein
MGIFNRLFSRPSQSRSTSGPQSQTSADLGGVDDLDMAPGTLSGQSGSDYVSPRPAPTQPAAARPYYPIELPERCFTENAPPDLRGVTSAPDPFDSVRAVSHLLEGVDVQGGPRKR